MTLIIVRAIIATLLLPLVWGCLIALFDTLTDASASAARSVVALTAGACLMWISLAFIRPHRLYVLGHELSHALWATLTGRRVHRVKVGKRSGSVTVSRSSMMLRLAPYLFPFYTLVLAAIFAIVSLLHDRRGVHWGWLAGFGATWAFHVAFTVNALSRPQSDIRRSGWFLSMVLILWVNLLVVAAGLCIATPATISDYFYRSRQHTTRFLRVFIPPLR